LDTELRIGTSAAVRLSGLRTPCILIDRFKAGLKSRLVTSLSDAPYRVGAMAIVTSGGRIVPGDPIRVILPELPRLPLPPL
jgi:MOSC domain-containing protein YiiM